MVRRKKTKTAALVLTVLCLLLSVASSVLDGIPIGKLGICPGCPLYARLLYSFFHASIPHAIINSWCLLSIVFVYDVPMAYLVSAYIIAVTFPASHFSFVISHLGGNAAAPTVGLSAVCFALLGMVSFQAKRRRFFHAWVLSFIVVCGFLLPLLCSVCGYTIATPNNILHIYSYVAGLMVGFLNSPAHHV